MCILTRSLRRSSGSCGIASKIQYPGLSGHSVLETLSRLVLSFLRLYFVRDCGWLDFCMRVGNPPCTWRGSRWIWTTLVLFSCSLFIESTSRLAPSNVVLPEPTAVGSFMQPFVTFFRGPFVVFFLRILIVHFSVSWRMSCSPQGKIKGYSRLWSPYASSTDGSLCLAIARWTSRHSSFTKIPFLNNSVC